MKTLDKISAITIFLLLSNLGILAQTDPVAEKLLDALKGEKYEEALLLVQNVNNANYRDATNVSLLTFAAYHGYSDICDILINKGANIDFQTTDGKTPLMMASFAGHSDLVSLLLEKGADPSVKSQEGKTAYDYAKNIDTRAFLIKYYIPKTRPNETSNPVRPKSKKQISQIGTKNDHDVLLLLKASSNGDLEQVRNLLESGYNIDERSQDGLTPLMMACISGQFEVASYLLSLGASLNSRTPIDSQDESAASTFGYYGIFKDEDTFFGITPLFLASKTGASDIVQLLLQKGADVNSITRGGASAIYIACQMGNSEVVKLLLDSKADPNLLTDFGWSPLFVAAYKGHLNTVQLLLDAGVDENFPGKTTLIKTTIKSIGESTLERVEQVTALDIASLAGNYDIVELLLRYGADPTLKDSKVKTAYDYAGDTDIKSLISIYKDKLNARKKYEENLWMQKESQAQEKIVEMEKKKVVPQKNVIEVEKKVVPQKNIVEVDKKVEPQKKIAEAEEKVEPQEKILETEKKVEPQEPKVFQSSKLTEGNTAQITGEFKDVTIWGVARRGGGNSIEVNGGSGYLVNEKNETIASGILEKVDESLVIKGVMGSTFIFLPRQDAFPDGTYFNSIPISTNETKKYALIELTLEPNGIQWTLRDMNFFFVLETKYMLQGAFPPDLDKSLARCSNLILPKGVFNFWGYEITNELERARISIYHGKITEVSDTINNKIKIKPLIKDQH